MKVREKGNGLMVLGILLLFVTGCPSGTDNVVKDVFQPPTLAVRQVMIREFTPEGVTLLLDLDINNPNQVGATVAKVDYNLAISGKPLVEGAIDTAVEIKPGCLTNAQVPVPLKYEDVIAVFMEAMGRDTVPYAISGKVWLKTPIGNLPIPYHHEDEFPVEIPLP